MVKIYFILLLSISCQFIYGQKNDTTLYYDHSGFIDWSSPVFKGDLASFIKERLKYPVMESSTFLEGTVVISYWVDTSGNTIFHKVIRGLAKDYDEEALRVARLIRYEKPAIRYGKPIIVRRIVPIKFQR